MISNNELYFLNESLDGKEIYGMNLLNDNIKTSAIKNKKYYKSNDFNKCKEQLLDNLKLYKQANKYVWIKDLIAAIVDDDWVVILKKFANDEVLLSKAKKSEFIMGLLNIYDYLKEDNEEASYPIKYDLKDILDKKISDENKWFYIKEVINKETVGFSIYFKEENTLFKYNLYTKILKNINPKKVRDDFPRLFKCFKDTNMNI